MDQDFRHAIQKETETVADYLRRLERQFQLAYGRDDLTMLYSQLQEGLLLSLAFCVRLSAVQTAVLNKRRNDLLTSNAGRCMYLKGTDTRQPQFKRRRPMKPGTFQGP